MNILEYLMEDFLDKLIDEITFSFLDVETTGLRPDFGDRICEIGILRCKKGEILSSFSTLINPSRSISPGAYAVNGITDEMVKDAPCFRDVAQDILRALEDSVITCHNAPFDIGFLSSEFQKILLSPPSNIIVDTLSIARRCYNFPSNSLGNIARFLGIGVESEHRALADVILTSKIFAYFINDLKYIETLKELLFIQGGSCSFLNYVEEITLPPFLEEAIRKSKRLCIRYVNSEGYRTIRIIEPQEVSVYGDYIYLIAFCHLRGERRTFRLDRIEEFFDESR